MENVQKKDYKVNEKHVYKKLGSPRPKETGRALLQNLRNFFYRKQKVGKFSNHEISIPKWAHFKSSNIAVNHGLFSC